MSDGWMEWWVDRVVGAWMVGEWSGGGWSGGWMGKVRT